MHSSWKDKFRDKNMVEQYGLIFRGFEDLKKKKKKEKHLSSLMQEEWLCLEIRILLSHSGVFDFNTIFS